MLYKAWVVSWLFSPAVADGGEDDEGSTLIARKVGEAVQNTLGAVATAIDIPLGMLWCL